MWFFCFLVSQKKSYSTCIKAVVPPPLLDLCKNPWSQTRKFFYHYLLLMWLHWIPIYFQCIQKFIKIIQRKCEWSSPNDTHLNLVTLHKPLKPFYPGKASGYHNSLLPDFKSFYFKTICPWYPHISICCGVSYVYIPLYTVSIYPWFYRLLQM